MFPWVVRVSRYVTGYVVDQESVYVGRHQVLSMLWRGPLRCGLSRRFVGDRLLVALVLTPTVTTGVGVVFQGSQGVVDTIGGRSYCECSGGFNWMRRGLHSV